jgi:hypothetical protein
MQVLLVLLSNVPLGQLLMHVPLWKNPMEQVRQEVALRQVLQGEWQGVQVVAD